MEHAAAGMEGGEIRFSQAGDGDTRLHVAEAGPQDGRLVLLLHGFPEFWYGWRHQIPALAGAGYRLLIPDLRGYNRSARPPTVAEYAVDRLVGDVLMLLDRAGAERPIVVGHDWGGALAWRIAEKFPARISRLAVLNCPPARILTREVSRNPRQAVRSWYAFFFQLPWLPERVLAARNYALLRRALVRTSRRGTFSEEDLRRYVEAWSQPGALTGMINWYRAAARGTLRRGRPSRPARRGPGIQPPALLIWGARDRFLGPDLARRTIEECARGRLEWLDATHWVQHEEPAQVNRLLLEFFAEEEEDAGAGEAAR